MSSYDRFETEGGVPIKAWTRGVALEDAAKRQLQNVAKLPVVFHHVAVMPDVHFGIVVAGCAASLRAAQPRTPGADAHL